MNTKDNITITSDQIEQFKQNDNEAKEKSIALLSNDTIKESTLQVVLELLQITRLNHNIKPEMFESAENYKDFLFRCIVEPYSFNINKQNEFKKLIECAKMFEFNRYQYKIYSYHTYLYGNFYKTISDKYRLEDYKSILLAFHMVMNVMIDLLSEKSLFHELNISPNIVGSYDMTEVINYYLFEYHIESKYDAQKVIPYLICYIYKNGLYNYQNLLSLICDCYKQAEEYEKIYNIAKLDNSSMPDNSFAAKMNAINNHKKSIIEAEENEYLKEILNYSNVILADTNIDSAVNALISSFPVNITLNTINYCALRYLFFEKSACKIHVLFDYKAVLKFYFEENDIIAAVHSLEGFSRVIKKRYQVPDEYTKEVTWCVFNNCVIHKYATKWISISVTGDIADKDIEEYIIECLNDDMINSNDDESISLLVFYLIYMNKHINNQPEKSFLNICYPQMEEYKGIRSIIKRYKDNRHIDNLELKLFGNLSNNNEIRIHYTMDDIDLMTGTEFEEFIAKLFNSMGYYSSTTKASGDQGIDVIAEKNGIKYGIQAKCYSGAVGNSAVQEAAAGKQFYGCDKVIVVTNNSFTKSAIKLAEANGVILWDRFILSEKLIYMN